MEREMSDPDIESKFTPELIYTPRTEIAPWSYVVGKYFKRHYPYYKMPSLDDAKISNTGYILRLQCPSENRMTFVEQAAYYAWILVSN